jgi:hypothetical protein
MGLYNWSGGRGGWFDQLFHPVKTAQHRQGQYEAGAGQRQGWANERVAAGTAAAYNPVKAALDAEEASLVDPTRRRAFAPVAARGFYGGLAKQSVLQALGLLNTEFTGRRNTALTSAMSAAQQKEANDQAAYAADRAARRLPV